MWLEKSIFGVFVDPTVALYRCVVGASSAEVALECALADAYSLSFTVMIGMSLFTFLASRVTGNDSWVDRLWSIIPVVYAWIFALFKPQLHKLVPSDIAKLLSSSSVEVPFTLFGRRITGPIVLACCVTVWGIRLTFNFWRRGGYAAGGEDYRWEHVRKWKVWNVPLLWPLFSFAFISVFQSILLWAIVVPMNVVPPLAPTYVELAIGATYLFLVAVEATADQQQWNFQNAKRNHAGFKRNPAHEQDYKRGFLTHGLFARSRHPNVWAEQQIWVVFFGSSVVYTGGLNATGIGAIVLILLTISSSNLTEKLAAKKYPTYSVYQRTVPMLVPAIFSPAKRLEEAFNKKK